MSVKDGYNKRVAFNTQDGLEDKMDKLTAMMGNLAARDSEMNRPFKPQVYQSKQSMTNSRSRSGSRASTNRERIRC